MKPIMMALPGNDDFADSLCGRVDVDRGELLVRRFPDGECYVRLLSPVQGRRVILVCTLDRPDSKLSALLFAAATARELGATEVGLVAPYLCYMRQDARFHDGEAVTARCFPQWISAHFDWLLTVDPHLHRIDALDEVYRCATHVVHAAPAVADWIGAHVEAPVIIGPDRESEQWVADIAQRAGVPYVTLRKTRRGDHEVEVTTPEEAALSGRTPVLIDDIVSTAGTMAAALAHLRRLNTAPGVCIAVHPIVAEGALALLEHNGAQSFVSCNSVAHSSNRIDLAPVVAEALVGRFACRLRAQ
jgi:ribose-phosphate pyrophosphokinase